MKSQIYIAKSEIKSSVYINIVNEIKKVYTNNLDLDTIFCFAYSLGCASLKSKIIYRILKSNPFLSRVANFGRDTRYLSTLNEFESVNLLYKSILCRNSDPAGLSYYSSKLFSGIYTNRQVALVLFKSTEFMNSCTICNKSKFTALIFIIIAPAPILKNFFGNIVDFRSRWILLYRAITLFIF